MQWTCGTSLEDPSVTLSFFRSVMNMQPEELVKANGDPKTDKTKNNPTNFN